MPRLPILQYPDPRLRQQARPVSDFDGELGQFVDDLFETLYGTTGIGLSAVQAGELRQVLVMDLSGRASEPREYINPAILSTSAPGIVEESCLSVPGIVGNVIRATQLRVRAQDRTGRIFEEDLEGMYAVCLQHEVDHLEGKLFIDRLSWFRRLRIRWSQGAPAGMGGRGASPEGSNTP